MLQGFGVAVAHSKGWATATPNSYFSRYLSPAYIIPYTVVTAIDIKVADLLLLNVLFVVNVVLVVVFVCAE